MTKQKELEKVREYYREVPYLFGLLRIEQIQRVESIGTELRIFCQIEPEKVFINGKEMKIL